MPIVVDTHAHIYSEDVERYPWIPNPYLPPAGHGTIEDLKSEVEQNGIDRVVVVQTFTVYRHDNRLTIDTVRQNSSWTTGVLNLDPFDARSIDLMRESRQVGVRGNRVSEGWGQLTTPYGRAPPTMGNSPGTGYGDLCPAESA